MFKTFSAALCVALSVATLHADPRTWTDTDGLQLQAEFVRVHNGRAVLTRFGKTLQVPLDSLSLKDQAWIQAELAKKEVRTWRKADGTEFRGKLLDYAEGNVRIRVDGKTESIPLVGLSRPDQEFVHGLLGAQGVEVVLPEPAPIDPADGDQPGGDNPAAPGGDPPDGGAAKAPPQGSPLDISHLQRSRVWTDLRQRKVEAKLDRVEDGFAVLLKEGKEIKVPITMLSPIDRAYIDSVAAMLAAHQEIEAERRMREAEAALLREEELARLQLEEEERMAVEQARLAEEELLRQEALAAAEAAALESQPGGVGESQQAGPGAGAAAPGVAGGGEGGAVLDGEGPGQIQADRNEPGNKRRRHCGRCKTRLPLHYKAGDECPNCGIFFESEMASDGSVVSVSWWWRTLNGENRTLNRAILFIIPVLLALLVWFVKGN